jgi:hypothetical protein
MTRDYCNKSKNFCVNTSDALSTGETPMDRRNPHLKQKRTNFMKINLSNPIRLILAAMVFLSIAASAQPPRVPAGKLQGEMRKLWNDHVALTRAYLLAAVANQPSARPTLQRLMENQVDIGNALKPYYGQAAGNQLTALLKEHIAIAGKIIESGKKAPLPSVPAISDWYRNADQIAALFHQLNPQYWSYEEMKNMMHHHLKITTSEVLSCLHGGSGAEAYQGIHRQAMQMADELSAGILRQFGGTRVG